MRISLISFTDQGAALAKQIEKQSVWEIGERAERHGKKEKEPLGMWVKRQFQKKNGIFFIGAAGIAVRAIAPFVQDKLTDSPVLVIDEKGQFVIPLLSGHMGGANELAVELAEMLGATPVITTATDVNCKFAVDVFARKQGLKICNRDGIEKVSAKILEGKKATIAIEGIMDPVEKKCTFLENFQEELELKPYPVTEKTDIIVSRESKKNEYGVLQLQPKEYVLGIGCRKGKEFSKLKEFIRKNLEEAGITEEDVCMVASITLKSEEEGILKWKNFYRVPFVTFTGEELKKVPGDFTESAFVERKTGVGNVCERAAMAACKGNGSLVLRKQAEDGMTLAIARKKWELT